MQKSIKTVGNSGQISLGKEFAGRNVIIEELEPGVWMIKTGEFIPDNEKWLHTPENKAKLDKAIEWARKNPPQETNFEEFEKQFFNETKCVKK